MFGWNENYSFFFNFKKEREREREIYRIQKIIKKITAIMAIPLPTATNIESKTESRKKDQCVYLHITSFIKRMRNHTFSTKSDLTVFKSIEYSQKGVLIYLITVRIYINIELMTF